MTRRRLTGASAAVLLLMAGAATGQEPEAPRPTTSPTPTPTPGPGIPRSIAASIDPIVARRLAREHAEPCAAPRDDDVPCFPARIDVRDADRAQSPLEALGADDFVGRPEFRRNANGSVVGGVGFDPVCAVKSLIKRATGRNDRYYLYRVWSARGEEVLLRESKLESGTQLDDPDFRYELIDEIRGECAAIAAWRQANAKARARAPGRAEDGPPRP